MKLVKKWNYTINFALPTCQKTPIMRTVKLFATHAHPVWRLIHAGRTIVDKERRALLLFCYWPIMVVGIIANFLGITAPSAPFFNYTHTLCLVAAVVVFLLFFYKKISVGTCLAAFTVIGQSILSVEMIYCALQSSAYYNFLIIANTVLLALNTMVSVAAYLRKNTIFLSCATIGIYVVCALLADSEILKSFIVVFSIAFCFVCLAGVIVATTTNKLERNNHRLEKYKDKLSKDKDKLERSNRHFRKEEVEMLHLLRLKKNEVKAFLSLASKQYDYDGMRVLFERLSPKSQHNLVSNVEAYIKTRATDLETIEKAFPLFTPSERDICRLILQGKKLSDICMSLNKNESNINSQRANMRRKLGLLSTDNLQQQLQHRLDNYSATTK